MQKTAMAMSFVIAYVERRAKKNKFFNHINKIVDWELIEKENYPTTYFSFR